MISLRNNIYVLSYETGAYEDFYKGEICYFDNEEDAIIIRDMLENYVKNFNENNKDIDYDEMLGKYLKKLNIDIFVSGDVIFDIRRIPYYTNIFK